MIVKGKLACDCCGTHIDQPAETHRNGTTYCAACVQRMAEQDEVIWAAVETMLRAAIAGARREELSDERIRAVFEAELEARGFAELGEAWPEARNRLYELRQAGRAGRAEVAERVGVDASTVRAWEHGRDPIPDDKQELLAAMFAVSIEWLMGAEAVAV